MKKTILLITTALLFAACSGKKDDSTPTPTVPAPIAAVLSTPSQNSVCTTGTVISATQSTVSFAWGASTNTDSYDLTITNLLTATSTTQNLTTTQASVTLLRNTPYAWYVVSRSNNTTATGRSGTWRFYNAGEGVVSYAPFPATITSPTFAQAVTATAGTVNLTWTGSTVAPGVTLTYDVYFGTTNSPPVFKSNVTDSFLNSVAVTSKTTYYWKVVTKDSAGNTSDSGLYQFSVN